MYKIFNSRDGSLTCKLRQYRDKIQIENKLSLLVKRITDDKNVLVQKHSVKRDDDDAEHLIFIMHEVFYILLQIRAIVNFALIHRQNIFHHKKVHPNWLLTIVYLPKTIFLFETINLNVQQIFSK